MNKDELAELGDGVYVDVETLIDGRALVQANSGGGKSYTIRKLCEITYGRAQQIILDPDGEFHTLREKHDYVLAGPGGEAPATVKSAALLARDLLELGASAVIDIYELGAKRPEYIARFVEAIMVAPRELWHDLIIVVDEANKFCPEGGKLDKMTQESMTAIVDLMTRGRKRGYCGVLATQRLAAVNKNAAAECNNVLIGRCSLDVDLERAAKMIGMKSSLAAELLPDLTRGQFYAMGPAIVNDWAPNNRVAKIQVGQVTTTHPKRGQKVPITPPRATIKKVLDKLKDLEEAAEIELNTIEGLNKQVAYWMGEFQRLKGVASTKTAETNEHFAHEYQAAWKSAQQEADDLRPQVAALTKERDDLRARATSMVVAYGHIPQSLRDLAEKMERAVQPSTAQVIANGLAKAGPTPNKPAPRVSDGTPPRHALEIAKPLNGSEVHLQPAQQRILETMALLERLGISGDVRTLAAWYCTHPRNKAFTNNLGKLRAARLVDGVRLTATGKPRVYAQMPTLDQHRARITADLEPAQRRIIAALVTHPDGLSPQRLGEALDTHPRNKALTNNVGKLRSRRLLTKGWPVRLAPLYFMKGA